METLLWVVVIAWAIIGPIGYIAGLWCIGRHLFSEHPEVSGLLGITILKAVMMIPPWGSITGPMVGISYLVGYQRRSRAEPLIQKWLENIDPKYVARSLDEQIKNSSVQKAIVASSNLRDDPWLKDNWIDQDPKQRIHIIREHIEQLRPNIRHYLKAWRFKTNFGQEGDPEFYVEANWAMALRDTIDPEALAMAKDVYDGL